MIILFGLVAVEVLVVVVLAVVEVLVVAVFVDDDVDVVIVVDFSDCWLQLYEFEEYEVVMDLQIL